MFKRALFAALALMLGGTAVAQPPVTYDLGLLTGSVTQSASVGSGTVTWIRFEIPEMSRCQLRYLDIVTETFNGFDSEIGLYDSVGKRITNDDDDGVGTASALSFGATSPLRPQGGDGVPGNGRDGPLPAGVYYLVLGEFDTFFGDTDWGAFSNSEGFGGGCNIHFNIGAGDPVNDPPGQFWESLCAVDAGDLPATAAQMNGSGLILEIHGFGAGRPDIDMYRVCITAPGSFEADTFQSVQMDTMLYLFDENGRGVTLNDDANDSVQSQLTSTVVGNYPAGTYFIAVAPYSSTPVDAAGQPLWDPNNTGERAADGPGAANPIAAWNSFVFNDNAWYILSLQGVSLCTGGPPCGSADFNCDGDIGTDADIEAFFSCLAGNCPALPCTSNADFNGDGDVGTDADIEAFFRVLAGGQC